MSQDTRKDKRAKVVSLNVRYKSATVDEFIENHSHDVSKGGIFVKTPTPFPPGTLLKFEIRLAGDKSVIAGVGRVVWKREPTSAGPDKPAGMGVKFIKIDDTSRGVIDRLTQQEGAGSAYTSDPAGQDEDGAGKPSTLRGLPAAKPASQPPAPSPASAPAAPAPASKTPASKTPASKAPGPSAAPRPGTMMGVAPQGGTGGALKGTMMGVAPQAGIPKPAADKPAADKPATMQGVGPAIPGAPTSKTPAADSKSAPAYLNAPVRKATMLGMPTPTSKASEEKPTAAQAKPEPEPPPSSPSSGETDSGWDDVVAKGALTSTLGMGVQVPADLQQTPTSPPAAAEPMFPTFPESEPGQTSNEPTVMKQAAALLEEALKEAGGSLDEIGQNPLFLQKGEKEPVSAQNMNQQSGDTAMMGGAAAPKLGPALGETPAPPPAIGGSQPPPPVAHAHKSTPPAAAAVPAPRAKPLREELEPKKKGGPGTIVALLIVVLVLAAGGMYAFQSGMLAGVGLGPKPTASPPPPPTAPSASASAPASASASAIPVIATGPDASTAAVEVGTADAGKEKDAGKATAETKPPPEKPTPAEKPAPAPAPAPRPKPKPTATPSAAPPATETSEAPPPPPPPAPAPAPAPTKSVDDPF